MVWLSARASPPDTVGSAELQLARVPLHHVGVHSDALPWADCPGHRVTGPGVLGMRDHVWTLSWGSCPRGCMEGTELHRCPRVAAGTRHHTCSLELASSASGVEEGKVGLEAPQGDLREGPAVTAPPSGRLCGIVCLAVPWLQAQETHLLRGLAQNTALPEDPEHHLWLDVPRVKILSNVYSQHGART